MSGGGSDGWQESLFDPEKGDSLGDGSWGRESEEPELTPVAWDKLPAAPNKNKARARLATPAPGSQKESGLLDIKALAPDLAKGMKNEGSPGPSSGPTAARLATAAKGSTGSGLIDVQEIVRAQEQQDASEKSGADAVMEALSESSGSMKASLLSSSLVDQPVVTLPPEDEPPEWTPSNRAPLLFVMGLLFVAAVGLAYYALSH